MVRVGRWVKPKGAWGLGKGEPIAPQPGLAVEDFRQGFQGEMVTTDQ